MDEKLKQYYEYLKGAGAKVPDKFESFQSTLKDDAKAKQYHSYLVKNKFKAPNDYNIWSSTLGIKKKVPTTFGEAVRPSLTKPEIGQDPLSQSIAESAPYVKVKPKDPAAAQPVAKPSESKSIWAKNVATPSFMSPAGQVAIDQKSLDEKNKKEEQKLEISRLKTIGGRALGEFTAEDFDDPKLTDQMYEDYLEATNGKAWREYKTQQARDQAKRKYSEKQSTSLWDDLNRFIDEEGWKPDSKYKKGAKKGYVLADLDKKSEEELLQEDWYKEPDTEAAMELAEHKMNFINNLAAVNSEMLGKEDVQAKLSLITQQAEQLGELRAKLDANPEDNETVELHNAIVEQYNEALADDDVQNVIKISKLQQKALDMAADKVDRYPKTAAAHAEKKAEQAKVNAMFDLEKAGFKFGSSYLSGYVPLSGTIGGAPMAWGTNFIGQAAVKFLGSIAKLPAAFDFDNEYTKMDRFGEFVTELTEEANNEIFPVADYLKKEMFYNDKDTGKLVWRSDLILPKVIQTGSDMVALIYGAGKAAKGLQAVTALTKGVKATELGLGAVSVTERVGLVASTFMQTFDDYKREGLDTGKLTPRQAIGLAYTQAVATGLIEAGINPQSYLFSRAGRAAKQQMMKEAINQVVAGKSYGVAAAAGLKFVGKQILGENLEEIADKSKDLLAKTITNYATDQDAFDVELQNHVNEFLEIIVTTSIVSGLPAAPKGALVSVTPHAMYGDAVKMIAADREKFMPMVKKALIENGATPEYSKKVFDDIAFEYEKVEGGTSYWVDNEPVEKSVVEQKIKEGKLDNVEIYGDDSLAKKANEKSNEILEKTEKQKEKNRTKEKAREGDMRVFEAGKDGTFDVTAKDLEGADNKVAKRLAKIMKMTGKVLSKITPNLKIAVYNGDEAGQRIFNSLGIKDRHMNHGFYWKGTIYLNLPDLRADTPFHEAIHPIINVLREEAPDVFKSFAEQAAGIAVTKDKYISWVAGLPENKRKKFEDIGASYMDINNGNMDEAVVEFLGDFVAGKFDGNKDIVDMIRDLIAQIMKAVGRGPKDIEIDLNDTESLRSFAEMLHTSFSLSKPVVFTGAKKAEVKTEGKEVQSSKKKTGQSKEITQEVDRINKLPLEAEDGSTFNIDGSKYTDGGLVLPVVSNNYVQLGNEAAKKQKSEGVYFTPDSIREFVEQQQSKISGDEFKLGFYKFPNQDQVSVDLNLVAPSESRELAIEIGRFAGQKSLFDLDTFEYVETGADGSNPKNFSDAELKEIASALRENRAPKFMGGEVQSSKKRKEDKYKKLSDGKRSGDGVNITTKVPKPKDSKGQGPIIDNVQSSKKRSGWLTNDMIVKVDDLKDHTISRVAFYDNTKVGNIVLKNRVTGEQTTRDGMGGFGYSVIEDIKKSKAVLAFVTLGQAIQTLKRSFMFPDSIVAIAMQNQQTSHLGNVTLMEMLWGKGGQFKIAAKNKRAEKDLVGIFIDSLEGLKKTTNEDAVIKAVDNANKVVDKSSSIEDVYNLVMKGGAFGFRNALHSYMFQDKPTKITKSTRESHAKLHYEYGLPTLSEIADAFAEPHFKNAQMGDIIKYVKPFANKVVYTSDEDLAKKLNENPSAEMINNGITVEYDKSIKPHESYPFIIKGDNIGFGDRYIGANEVFEDIKNRGIKKSQSFYPVGRRKMDAPAGRVSADATRYEQPIQSSVKRNPYTSIVNGFYSPIENRLNETKLEKQSVQKWKSVIGTGDEAKWTGVSGWLNSMKPDQTISKSEILDFMKNNRVEIKEKVRGVGSEEKMTAWRIIDNNGNAMGAAYDTKAEAEADVLDLFPNRNFSVEERDTAGMAGDMQRPLLNPAKFSSPQFNLEGEKTDYKEVLVMLPNKGVRPIGKWEFYEREGYTQEEFENAPKEFQQKLFDKWKAEASLVVVNKKEQFKSSHYDEDNILVHLRMDTRTDSEGNKVLFLEEVQSDWGQKGKREGFDNKEIEKKRNELRDKVRSLELEFDSITERKKIANTGSPSDYVITSINEPRRKEVERELTKLDDEIRELSKHAGIIPQAPYVTETPSWTKLGLKVALKEAVRQGADKIAWTTGEQQNDRYDLSKQVDKITVNKKDGVYVVSGKRGSDVLSFGEHKAEALENVIGKELAQKAIEETKDYPTASFEGQDLKVGGKGMIGFYGSPKDGKLGIVGEVAKKVFGQEPEVIKINTAIPLSESTRRALADDGWTTGVDESSLKEQHSIDVTPELKESVADGLPQFSKKRAKPRMTAPKGKVFNRTAERVALAENTIYKQIQAEVLANPSRYIFTKQNLKDKQADLSAMSEWEIVQQIDSVDALNAAIDLDNNFSVLAAIELINRLVAAGKDTKPVFDKLVKLGRGIGQLLRQFAELKTGTPDGIIRIVTEGLASQGYTMSKDQADELQKVAREFIKSKLESENALVAAENAPKDQIEQKFKEFTDKKNKQAERFRDLNLFVTRITPFGMARLLGTILQGNLLKLTSIGANVAGNVLFMPLRKVELAGGDLGTYIHAHMYGRPVVGPMVFLGSEMAAFKAFWGGLPQVGINTLKGDMAGLEQQLGPRRGLHPFTAIWQMATKKGRATLPIKRGRTLDLRKYGLGKVRVPANNVGLYTEKLLEGTAGINAEIMFRMLYATDEPFKRGARAAALWRMYKQSGTKESLQQFEAKLTQAQRDMIEVKANQATFSDERTLSKGADSFIKGTRKFAGLISEVFPEGPMRDGWNAFFEVLLKANIPFVRVPANLVQYMVELTVPIIPLLAGIRYFKKDPELGSKLITRGILGMAFLYGADALIEAGAIVAGGEGDDEEERAMKYEGQKQNTINIDLVHRWAAGGWNANQPIEEGDRYLEFSKLGPLGIAMVARAKMRENVKQGNKKKNPRDFNELSYFTRALEMLNAGSRSTLELAFLQGTSAFVDAIKDDSLDKYLSNVGNTMMAIPLPNNVTAVTMARREFMLRGKDTESILNDFLEKQSIKWYPNQKDAREGVYPVISMWGKMVEQNPKGSAYKGIIGDMHPIVRQFFDVTRSGMVTDPVTVEIWNLSQKLNEFVIGPPDGSVTVYKKTGEVDENGEDVWDKVNAKMTEGDHVKAQIIAGQLKRMNISSILVDPEYQALPDKEKLEVIRNISNDANSVSKEMVFREIMSAIEAGTAVVDPEKKIYQYVEQDKFDYIKTLEQLQNEIED